MSPPAVCMHLCVYAISFDFCIRTPCLKVINPSCTTPSAVRDSEMTGLQLCDENSSCETQWIGFFLFSGVFAGHFALCQPQRVVPRHQPASVSLNTLPEQTSHFISAEKERCRLTSSFLYAGLFSPFPLLLSAPLSMGPVNRCFDVDYNFRFRILVSVLTALSRSFSFQMIGEEGGLISCLCACLHHFWSPNYFLLSWFQSYLCEETSWHPTI